MIGCIEGSFHLVPGCYLSSVLLFSLFCLFFCLFESLVERLVGLSGEEGLDGGSGAAVEDLS